MKKLTKSIGAVCLTLAMVFALAVPAFASGISARQLPSWTLLLPSRDGRGVLTVATFGSAGNNDPVYSWTEMTDANESTVPSQHWHATSYAGYTVIKPSTNESLSLNAYRGNSPWTCTVYSLADNSYEDYALSIETPSGNICRIKLPYQNNYTLTNSYREVQKFSTGTGYAVVWQAANDKATNQEWYYTTPN